MVRQILQFSPHVDLTPAYKLFDIEATLRQFCQDKRPPLSLLKLLVHPVLCLHHLHFEFVGLQLQHGLQTLILCL